MKTPNDTLHPDAGSAETRARTFESRARFFEAARERLVTRSEPVAACLREAAIETGHLPEVFRAIAERIEQGTSVKQAFSSFPDALDLGRIAMGCAGRRPASAIG